MSRYGSRVLYELIQNAHDANLEEVPGDVTVRPEIDNNGAGILYVANGGVGFNVDNVQAIRNIANSTKEIGEGIGNKGIGFRSVEALTDDPKIYSRNGVGGTDKFDGYCFRFATASEIESRLRALGHDEWSVAVSQSLPKYLASVPTIDQPPTVREFAAQSFVTVVELPLRDSDAVQLARRQVQDLMDSEVPLLLFLERIRKLHIEVVEAGVKQRRLTLTRDVKELPDKIERVDGCVLQIVTLSPEKKRWLVVRRILDRARVIDAVQRSIGQESALKRWLQWKGTAVVSAAVPLDGEGLENGRLYNFLPMGSESKAPLRAHLDAPFFTAIDRRRAKLELPLNSELLNACCETCVAAALTLANRTLEFPARVVVDLVAWIVGSFPRLQTAFKSRSA